jgi:hypothetical protein
MIRGIQRWKWCHVAVTFLCKIRRTLVEKPLVKKDHVGMLVIDGRII